MTTATLPPTTRQLANGLRSMLEWIQDHADTLPGGWHVSTYVDMAPTLNWSSHDCDPQAVFAALVNLLGEPTVGTTWANEGPRPMLTVHGVRND